MNKQGIWKHREIKKEMNTNTYLTLNEGNTPTEEISPNVSIKREDANPTGSWKDRGTAWKITQLQKDGIKEAVISSSGNAAISILEYCNQLAVDIKIHVVVSPDINVKKKEILERLTENNHQLHYDKQARRRSSQISAGTGAVLLRASMDSSILTGYWSLGLELYKEMSKDDDYAIFCPVSSGTGLVGMVQGLFMEIEDESKMPQIIACQTEAVHPVCDQLNVALNVKRIGRRKIINTASEDRSLADAIVDKTVLRMPQILNTLDNTNGRAIEITNKELEIAKEKTGKLGVDLSYTSLLSVAGYYQMEEEMKGKKVICIASGR